MGKGRLEAFSDGVIAIIITIMVLELKVPHSPDLAALRPMVPALLSYVLSFVFVGIYWNQHHHLLHAVQKINGRVLWANLHLLFWLSIVPLVTDWMGEKSPGGRAGGALWSGAVHGGLRVHDSFAGTDCLPGGGFRAGACLGERLQEQSLAAVLRDCGAAFVCEYVDFRCVVRSGGLDVVYTRPQDRKSGCRK